MASPMFLLRINPLAKSIFSDALNLNDILKISGLL